MGRYRKKQIYTLQKMFKQKKLEKSGVKKVLIDFPIKKRFCCHFFTRYMNKLR